MLLTYKINKSAKDIFNYLSDMQQFESVHPIIYKIDKLAENKYHFFEKLPFGFLSINNDYKVQIDADAARNTIKMYAFVKKLIHINLLFTITEHNGYCIVNEEVNFKSILPLKPFLNPIFKTQHKLLFENMEKE